MKKSLMAYLWALRVELYGGWWSKRTKRCHCYKLVVPHMSELASVASLKKKKKKGSWALSPGDSDWVGRRSGGHVFFAVVLKVSNHKWFSHSHIVSTSSWSQTLDSPVQVEDLDATSQLTHRWWSFASRETWQSNFLNFLVLPLLPSFGRGFRRGIG